MVRRLHPFIFLLPALAAGSATAATTGRTVVVPLVAEPLKPEETMERVVGIDEPFMRQRLTALKSATLSAEVAAPTHDGVIRFQTTSAPFPKGSRLVLAIGRRADGRYGDEFYCGSYTLPAAQALAIGKWKVQWLCFEDTDRDGVFDLVYETNKDATLVLPSFTSLTNPLPVKAPYAMDEEASRYYFERAVVHAKAVSFVGGMSFVQKARRQDDAVWSNFDPSRSGVEGWSVMTKNGAVPVEVQLAGAAFTVIGRDGQEGLAIRPGGAKTGTIFFGVTYR